MSETLIDNQQDFESLCAEIREAGLVAFDTEFVAEHSYNPELCLMQFATRDRCVAVDPFEMENLNPWWEIMADEEIKVVVHGGQAEIRFCLIEGNLKPANLYDTQISEAFRSRSYPLSYVNLVQRVLKIRPSGKETRTNWKRRPLLPNQAKYALEDVVHMLPIYDDQTKSLVGRGRLKWAVSEIQQMIDDITADLESPGWLKLSGLHRLQPKELVVARELFNWREDEAESRDRPPRSVLRDDLILELARRRPKNSTELLATRDMERDRYRRHIDDLVEVVMGSLAGKGERGYYHIATGSDFSIKELFDATLKALDITLDEPVEVKPRGDDDVFTILIDPSKTEAHFDWKADTPLDEGIQRAIDYYREFGIEQTFTHLKAIEDYSNYRYHAE